MPWLIRQDIAIAIWEACLFCRLRAAIRYAPSSDLLEAYSQRRPFWGLCKPVKLPRWETFA